MTYFKEKNFTSEKGNFSNISTEKPKKKLETPQTKKMHFLKQSYIYFLPIQNYMKHINFQKFCQNHWTLLQRLFLCPGGILHL
jgi:hypothetical protein